ncbi:hypothetical protein GQ44DRAFT_825529 [Phaeosphaeriaceae sp. PMI808]|nr:hypothetical protein GQ44DRAFT_825529 [Phaeosphaeriaceae sp. PMI808]
MSSSSVPFFGPTCPLGGKWYACSTGQNFVGCCAQDPCRSTCAAGSLYPAGFNPAYHEKFDDAQCGSLALFYTCTAGNTFMGCCKTNPCATGSCTGGNLAPAYLDTAQLREQYGAVPSAGAPTRTSTTSASTATSSGLSTSTSPGPPSMTATTQPKSGPPVAAIAGGVAGAGVGLAIIIGLLIYFICHAKKSRQGHKESLSRRQSDLSAMMAEHNKSAGTYPPDAPPGYSSPKPNEYYGAHTAQSHYQQTQPQYASDPQELPNEPSSPTLVTKKPAVGHQRNLSELSGDTAMISELETPLGSPHKQSQFASPLLSPQMGAQVGWQTTSSVQPTSNWMAQQSWQTQREADYSGGPMQGQRFYEQRGDAPEHRPDVDAMGISRV